ncbi:hypothetical protein V8D89_006112 [Ganoderma adspersum]
MLAPDTYLMSADSSDFDERGVGALSIHCEFTGKRKERDEAVVDDELAHQDKRMKNHEDWYPSNPPQAYDACTPADSSFAEPPYSAMGNPSYYPQALQYPQEMQYHQGMHYQPSMEQGAPYQQTMEHAYNMGYPPMYPSAYAPQHTTMPTAYKLPPTFAPSAVPWDMQSMPQDFSYPSHNARYPPEFSAHGGPDLPYVDGFGDDPNGHDDDADEDEDDTDGDDVPHEDDNTDEYNTDEDSDSDGDDDGDNDEEMSEPSEKAQGKRPDWGASTSVHEGFHYLESEPVLLSMARGSKVEAQTELYIYGLINTLKVPTES